MFYKLVFKKVLLFAGCMVMLSGFAQDRKSKILEAALEVNKGHSHNDYLQDAPFYNAYKAGMGSIEADVFLVNGVLHVAHERHEVKPGKTLLTSYLIPLAKKFKANGNKPYADGQLKLQLVIDIKDNFELVIPVLIKEIAPYLQVFDESKNKNAVKLVLSGNMPVPDDFQNYPSHIYFDGRPYLNYSSTQLERVAMISDALANYTKWKGLEALSANDHDKLAAVVKKAHQLNKPFRFWGTGDNKSTWITLKSLGVNWINTDHPDKLNLFYREQ